jgi:signal peptidase
MRLLLRLIVAGVNVACLLAIVLFIAVIAAPRLTGVELRRVVSGSMEPSIAKGSLAVAFPVSARDLRAGDVIVFRQPGQPGNVITHRIVRIYQEDGRPTFETRGDANGASDLWRVRPGDVLGELRFQIPYAGYAVEQTRSVTGFIFLLVLPALALIGGEIPLWYRALRGRDPASAHEVTPPVLNAGRSPLTWSAVIIVFAVVTATAATMYFAPRPGRFDDRVLAESQSIAANLAGLAEAEAFAGDIQLLRDVEDPRLRVETTPEDERLTALRQMLLVNTNRFESLMLIALDGRVLASTGALPVEPRQSPAFLRAVATDGIASIVTGPAIEFAAPVRSMDGRTQSVLLARASVDRLWSGTLATSIDGSTARLARTDGTPITAGGEDAGVCAMAPVARDTTFGGLRAVACLPAALAGAPAYPLSRAVAAAAAVSALTAAVAILLLLAVARTPASWRSARRAEQQAMESRLLSYGNARPPWSPDP